jgi:hypothetical protein
VKRRFPRTLPVLLALAILATGCQAVKRVKVGYYLAPGGIPSDLTRVVFLPLVNHSPYPTASEGMTGAIAQAIQGTKLFHLEVAPPADAAYSCLPPDGQSPFTLKQLGDLRQSLGCDAVLVGVVNQFQPYPHMQGGIYIRLVDLRTGRLIWAVDHVWDTADERVRRRIQEFFECELGKSTDPLQWRLATVSPQAFDRFVAYEVAATLPRRLGDPTATVSLQQARAQKL